MFILKISIYSILFFSLINCNKKQADTLIYNAQIQTVNEQFETADAMVIKNEKIIFVGKQNTALQNFKFKTKLDIQQQYVYPGFIDAHAHLLGYGLQLNTVNLLNTKSWEDVINKVNQYVKENNIKPNTWITGRGWDQNDWNNKVFPNNEQLSQLYPNNPIMLTRIDGHAAIVNKKAIALAKLQPNQKIVGGTLVTENNALTGLLIDNAVDLVTSVIPTAKDIEKTAALQKAAQNCFAVGLTTVDDCGIDAADVELLKKLYRNNQLSIKVYAMLSDNKNNFEYLLKNGKYNSKQLNVNGFKIYSDGALGSRGACLLDPYHDKKSESGFLLSSFSHFDSVAQLLYQNKMQMCTHAIGDSANRTILNIYGKYLKEKNDLRWRIEHAQVVHENDMALFGKYSIVPSVQPTHATSDMYWAADRLGNTRIKTAYAYNQLLQQNNWMPLGTDFPVEDISPFKTFYAAVVRKDEKQYPLNGFQKENAITRKEALQGMTIWAAKSNFEEKLKGSIEVGKYADFIILNTNLLTCEEIEILNTKVISTWINGKKVWGN
jgi:predicted amidohydrolase YtcJ